ncbi:MAG TPA: aminotransferase class V-fold PLP-dependent enzyme, partial [Steroidobacteraceae bacterium]|nr:aminotransferase class V-fold PLP-dependent enzyme [Steroidobacteraceae bacterium]
IMHVNNETGVVQDIRAIGELCRERAVVFHSDAAQSAGKVPIDVGALPVDLLSLTAHKLYGPKGIGALYVRPPVRAALRAVTFGGGQERGLRPGTHATHQIVGFGVAAELAKRASLSEPARIGALRDRLWHRLQRLDGVHLNGAGAPRLPEMLNVSFEGVDGESLVTALQSVAVTTGSACSSASGEPSYVLRALGRSTQLAQSSLRFSLGRGTSEADIDNATDAVCRQVLRLRSVSPAFVSPSQHPETLASSRLQTAQVAVAYGPETGGGLDTLSPAARRYFDELPGAGTLSGTTADTAAALESVVSGEAGSVGEDAWVRFHLRVSGGNVKAALFQAYGCPHTLAVTSWLSQQLPGRPRTDLVPGTPAAWLEAMDVPVEKLGRLLVIEDALRATLMDWT